MVLQAIILSTSFALPFSYLPLLYHNSPSSRVHSGCSSSPPDEDYGRAPVYPDGIDSRRPCCFDALCSLCDTPAPRTVHGSRISVDTRKDSPVPVKPAGARNGETYFPLGDFGDGVVALGRAFYHH